jgi:hypothetical protein
VTEGSARITVGSFFYASGYPNGPLYKYDPANPWLITGPNFGQNPLKLGNYSDGFSLSGIKRAEVLVYSSMHGRMYMGGLCDRSGVGAGIGYCTLSAKTFGGLHTGLDHVIGDLGLVVFDALDRVVFGGAIDSGQTPDVAQLVVYDHNLDVIECQPILPTLRSTGYLFRTNEAQVVVGLSKGDQLLYRWNFVTKTLLDSVDLSTWGAVRAFNQGADGLITAVLGVRLVQIDPVTFAFTDCGTLEDGSVSCLVQLGDDLYLSIGPNLYRIPNFVPVDGGRGDDGGGGGGADQTPPSLRW